MRCITSTSCWWLTTDSRQPLVNTIHTYLVLHVVGQPASGIIMESKQSTSVVAEGREPVCPGHCSQYCLSLSPRNALWILPYTIRFQWSLSPDTQLCLQDMEETWPWSPLCGSVCVFTWACACICWYSHCMLMTVVCSHNSGDYDNIAFKNAKTDLLFYS